MKKIVLIAEDKMENALSALAAMKDLDVNALTVPTVEMALAMIEKGNILAVLTDMQMPLKENEGVNAEAGKIIVKKCLAKNIPVAIVTQVYTSSSESQINFILPFFNKQRLIKIIGKDKNAKTWKKAFQLLKAKVNLNTYFAIRQATSKYRGEMHRYNN